MADLLMPFLIDCYNVLHAVKPPSLAGLDTSGLCAALARTPWREEGVKVVCDGTPHVLDMTAPGPQVELVYAGGGKTADDVIIHLVDVDSAPRRLVVVSSDHVIRQAARRRRATSWTSEQFLHELSLQLAQPGPGPGKPKVDQLPPAEVDRWLERFGYDPGEFEEPEDADEPWPPPM